MTAVTARGSWAATGWDDPAMGDVGSVRDLAARFQHRADDLRALNVELTQGLAGLGGWHGQAADRFRENQQRLRLGLDEFVVRFERCRAALDSYAHAMDQRRAESNALLPRVLDAKRRLATAQHDILHPPSVEALSRGLTAQPFLIAELEKLGVEWGAIRTRHMGSAAWCAQQLQDSDGTALGDLFRDARGVLAAGQQKLGDLSFEVDRWLSENADTIAAITSVLEDVNAAVSIASLFYPPLGAVAFGLTVAVAVGKGMAYSGGSSKVSRRDVQMGVLDVATGSLLRHAGPLLDRRAVGAARSAAVAGDVPSLMRAHQVVNQALAFKQADKVHTAVEDGMHLVDAAPRWIPRQGQAPQFWQDIQDAHAADMKRRQEHRALPVVEACR
ncbi:WXG100 family type VII secretion target [Actinomycetospora sp. OC33-EN08]|uniref:WXG100 family type VII secretion target n=1 Tax=Actinomycetospora aurantiaca TaxID=3129233 RepID=A0ABU8MGI1_9PSEU